MAIAEEGNDLIANEAIASTSFDECSRKTPIVLGQNDTTAIRPVVFSRIILLKCLTLSSSALSLSTHVFGNLLELISSLRGLSLTTTL